MVTKDEAAAHVVAMLNAAGHGQDATLSSVTPGRLTATVRPPNSSRVFSVVLDVTGAQEI